jgi:5-methylcytosine-specific restriction endonuclease McrA
VLRKIFEPKREEVARSDRRLHNEELHNLYTSQNIIRVTKRKVMNWTGHVARVRETRTKFLSENVKQRDQSEDLGQIGKYYNGFLGNRVGSCGLNSSGL